MHTETKFKFIFKIISTDKKEKTNLEIIFNRFEQQKFKENCQKEANFQGEKIKALFIQFFEQVDIDSIPLLKKPKCKPFSTKLIGENSIDIKVPGSELFYYLVEELNDTNLGIFTFNPKRRHKNKETNQEDLIINRSKTNKFLDDEYSNLFKKRFVYAGALIACCIVSNLPQPLKLSSIIWDYLTHEEVSIESVYEIDSNFKILIQNCEEIQKKASFNLTQEEFENLFLHNFEINDSFDEKIELIPSGSKTRVTRENLQQFIEFAKFKRQNEFIDELK